MKEISVQELKEKKEKGEDFLLLDVRDSFEYLVSNLNGLNVPENELEGRLDELKEHSGKDIVVMCRSGGRSSRVADFLQKKGFEGVIHLKGGLKKWVKEIDPSLPVA